MIGAIEYQVVLLEYGYSLFGREMEAVAIDSNAWIEATSDFSEKLQDLIRACIDRTTACHLRS